MDKNALKIAIIFVSFSILLLTPMIDATILIPGDDKNKNPIQAAKIAQGRQTQGFQTPD